MVRRQSLVMWRLGVKVGRLRLVMGGEMGWRRSLSVLVIWGGVEEAGSYGNMGWGGGGWELW